MVKKYLIILLLLVGHNLLFAQYLALPDSNAYWIEGIFGGTPGFTDYYQYQLTANKNDTVIGSNTYHKVFIKHWFTYSSYSLPVYIGSFRQSINGKVFFISKDSVNEYILYDYSLKVGDTIKNVFASVTSCHLLYHATVTCIDSLLIENKYHKTIEIQPFWNNYTASNIYCPPPMNTSSVWYEGITSGEGLISFPFGGFMNKNLYCMKYSDTTFFYPAGIGNSCQAGLMKTDSCHVPITTSVIEIDKSSFNIFPNPSDGYFSIYSKNPFTKISIFNLLGDKIFESSEQKQNTNLNLSENPNGIYFIHVYQGLENQYWFKEIINK